MKRRGGRRDYLPVLFSERPMNAGPLLYKLADLVGGDIAGLGGRWLPDDSPSWRRAVAQL